MSARQRIRLRFEPPPSVNPSFQYVGQLCLTFFTCSTVYIYRYISHIALVYSSGRKRREKEERVQGRNNSWNYCPSFSGIRYIWWLFLLSKTNIFCSTCHVDKSSFSSTGWRNGRYDVFISLLLPFVTFHRVSPSIAVSLSLFIIFCRSLSLSDKPLTLHSSSTQRGREQDEEEKEARARRAGVEASASWVASVNLLRVSIGCLSTSVNGSLCNLNNYYYHEKHCWQGFSLLLSSD